MSQKTESKHSCRGCMYGKRHIAAHPCSSCAVINPAFSVVKFVSSIAEMSKMDSPTATTFNPLKLEDGRGSQNYGPLPQAKKEEPVDPGAHYRYEFKGVKIDPARIAKVYGIGDGMVFTILKKALRMGRAHKDKRQDLLDIISAAQRELEMMAEDGDEN